MNKRIALATLVALVLGMVAAPSASSAQQAKKAPKVYAVAFHADWCAKCKELGPKVMPLMKDAPKMGVQMVKIDRTNDKTTSASNKEAAKLKLDKVVQANKGTGFILMIEPKTFKVLGKVTADMAADDIKQMFMLTADGQMVKGCGKCGCGGDDDWSDGR